MIETSILTSKGQTTIPKEVREFLGLQVGDRIVYIIEEGEVKLQAARQQIETLFGAFGSPPEEAGEEDREEQETFL